MAVRNIVNIDEEKCNGCGKCVNACIEGAIQLIDGKAKLVSEIYCDGLGACIGSCPQDAITVEQREAAEFDEKAVTEHLKKQSPDSNVAFVCPGLATHDFDVAKEVATSGDVSSKLSHWPVQLELISPNVPYLKNAELAFVADCVPFAMGDFHEKILKNHKVIVGCPKLDDAQLYIEKLAEIIKINCLKSLTVVHMEVPCCSKQLLIAEKAIELAGVEMSFTDIMISIKGEILNKEQVNITKS